jgi:hypothetical protein
VTAARVLLADLARHAGERRKQAVHQR